MTGFMMRSTSLALEATKHDKDHYRLNLVVGEVTSRLHEVVAANRRLQQVLAKSTVSPVAASHDETHSGLLESAVTENAQQEENRRLKKELESVTAAFLKERHQSSQSIRDLESRYTKILLAETNRYETQIELLRLMLQT